MFKHTPIPWKVEGFCIKFGERFDSVICELKDSPNVFGNAHFIVTACNCHDELLRRLKVTNRALQAAIDAINLVTPGVRMTLEVIIKYNKQAIAKVEERRV